MLDQLTSAIEGGSDLARQMIRAYLRELPGRRVRLQTAVRQAAPRRIVVAADGLRAASLTIGAMGVARVCGTLLDSVSGGDPDDRHTALAELLDVCHQTTDELTAVLAQRGQGMVAMETMSM